MAIKSNEFETLVLNTQVGCIRAERFIELSFFSIFTLKFNNLLALLTLSFSMIHKPCYFLHFW